MNNCYCGGSGCSICGVGEYYRRASAFPIASNVPNAIFAPTIVMPTFSNQTFQSPLVIAQWPIAPDPADESMFTLDDDEEK